MKINSLLESAQLDENLGNLAKLNLGNLVNILKQNHDGVGKKFTSAWQGPGNTSEIVDKGVLKKGIVGLRKAYRDYVAPENAPRGWLSPYPVGFAVYLNNRAVAFGLFTADALAGRTRSAQFAYDLSGFEAQIDAAHERENADRPRYNQTRKMEPNSAYDREEKDYPNGWRNDPVISTKKFVGSSTSTDDLSTFLTRLDQIAIEVGGTITLKLVTNDYTGGARKRVRNEAAVGLKEIREGGKDLRQRLLRYKNSKRPTAENIHRFMEMVITKSASVVNFGGRPWKTTPYKGYSESKISPIDLMSGKPFVMEYQSAEADNTYETIKISYRYDASTNTIKPWQAQYTDDQRVSKTIPMDVEYWVKDKLKVTDLEKPSVLKAMLTRIKDAPGETTFSGMENIINAMRSEGIDWPEFAIIEKSIATERAKPKEQ